MINVSDDLLEAIGFRRLTAGELYSAEFHALRVFELRGVVVTGNDAVRKEGEVRGVRYTMAVANSVNAACRALVDDDWVDGSEDEWQQKNRSSPPYLVVHVGPTRMHRMTGAIVHKDAWPLRTYDGFPDARAELRAMEDAVIPGLMSAVSSALSSPENRVGAVAVERTAYGLTADGRECRDSRLIAKGVGMFSTTRSIEAVGEALEHATRTAAETPEDVSRILWLGLEGSDPLKRFFFLFLGIERQVHRTFLENVTDAERDAAVAAAKADCGRNPLRPILARFKWCASNVWKHLGDADIAAFKRLKDIRDDIAHGSVTEPTENAVRDVEVLATLLHRGR